MSLPQFVSRNGELIQPAAASISVFNPAIYGAYGVYESLQVVHGAPFALRAHLHRLARSAALLELSLPADMATFGVWISEVLSANDVGDATLRIFVLGDDDGLPQAFIWPQEPLVFAEPLYADGATVVTYEAERFMPRAKSLNTLTSYLARRHAAAAGAHEGVLHHAGRLTEGSNSNLFAVIDGDAVTPSGEDVLAGVTRDILLCLSSQVATPVREETLPVAGIPNWSECFITSTSRHIMPVTQIDGRPVGDGRVGPVTRRLSTLFENYFEQATGRGSVNAAFSVPDCERALLAD